MLTPWGIYPILRELIMKLYTSTQVTFSYQNFGSAWLGILRGPTEEIEHVFNGLYNLCGTHGKLTYPDHLGIVGLFWTDRKMMRRFFFNRYTFPYRVASFAKQGKFIRKAMRHALAQLKLVSKHHEEFRRYAPASVIPYCNGSITAERPDTDMKDAIMSHAFSAKE